MQDKIKFFFPLYFSYYVGAVEAYVVRTLLS